MVLKADHDGAVTISTYVGKIVEVMGRYGIEQREVEKPDL